MYPAVGSKDDYIVDLCNQAHAFNILNKYVSAIEMCNMALELNETNQDALTLKSYAIIALEEKEVSERLSQSGKQ